MNELPARFHWRGRLQTIPGTPTFPNGGRPLHAKSNRNTIIRREKQPKARVHRGRGQRSGNGVSEETLAATVDLLFPPPKRKRKRKAAKDPAAKVDPVGEDHGPGDRLGEEMLAAMDGLYQTAPDISVVELMAEKPSAQDKDGAPIEAAVEDEDTVTEEVVSTDQLDSPATDADDRVSPPEQPDLIPLEARWMEDGLAPEDTPLPDSVYDPELGLLPEEDDPVSDATEADTAEADGEAQEDADEPPDENPNLLHDDELEALEVFGAGPTAADNDTDGASAGLAPVMTDIALADQLWQEDIDSDNPAADMPLDIAALNLEEKIDQLTQSLSPLWGLRGEDFLTALEGLATDHKDSASTSNAKALQERLDSIIGSLHSKTIDYERLEASIKEMTGTTEIDKARRDALSSMMASLADDVRELKTQMGVANKAALASAKSMNTLNKSIEVTSSDAVADPRPARRSPSQIMRPSTMVMGSGILLLSWAMMFYLKTGNLHLALLGLVVVNLAGCATILLGKSED